MKLIKILQAVTVLFLGAQGYSQTQFQKTIGTGSNDLGYQIVSMPNGDLFLTGNTSAGGGGGEDSYLLKLNQFGVKKWGLSFGVASDETTWDLIKTQGNALVGLGTSSSLPGGGGSTLTRMDTAGNVTWLYVMSSFPGPTELYCLMETSTGHLVAAGLVGSISNQDNILVCKFGPGGNLLWSKSVETAQSEEIMGITETSDGNYLLAGLTNDNNGNGSSDFAVVKVAPSGNVLWQRNYGGTSGERLNSVIEVDGSYYFCGWSSSAGQGGDDMVVMKTDTAGTFQWAYTYGTAQNDRAFRMLYNEQDSTIVIAGYTDYSAGTNNRNTVLLSIDKQGTMKWAKSYGSTGTDGHWPTGLTRSAADEGYYLLGVSSSFTTGDDDLYLIKTNSEGDNACYLKDPQFTQDTIAGWTGSSFGSVITPSVTTGAFSLSGTSWLTTSNNHCCELWAYAGPDRIGCPVDSVTLGSDAVTGYNYTWAYNGNVISNQSSIRVAFIDSGSYFLTVSAPTSNCVTAMDTVILKAHPTPSKPVITIDSTGQLVSGNGAAFQWFLNGDSIPGATMKTYLPVVTGYYQVMISNPFGCMAISDSLLYVPTALGEFREAMAIELFPNPVTDDLNVRLTSASGNVALKIYDIRGNLILGKTLSEVTYGVVETLQVSNFSAGVYFMKIGDRKAVQVIKFTKK